MAIIDHAEKADLILYAARVAYREERWGRQGDGEKAKLIPRICLQSS